MRNFKEVVQHYERIAPVVSSNHSRENDIRPVESRRKKDLRIEKVSDECYVYTGSWKFFCDYKHKNTGYNLKAVDRVTYLQELYTTASVIWTNYDNKEVLYIVSPRYKAKKSPYITSGSSVNHVWLFENYTPVVFSMGKCNKGIYPVESKFTTNYLHHGNNTVTHDKPKSSDNPCQYLSGHLAYVRDLNGDFVIDKILSGEDCTKVVRLRVDKKLKAEYKPHIESVYNYFSLYESSMYEVTAGCKMTNDTWGLSDEEASDKLIIEFVKALYIKSRHNLSPSNGVSSYSTQSEINKGGRAIQVREVLMGDNEELKLGLLKYVCASIKYASKKNNFIYNRMVDFRDKYKAEQGGYDLQWKHFVQDIRTAFNKHLNEMCNFATDQLVDTGTP